MGMICAFKDCNNSYKINQDLIFFRFPKDKERFQKWVSACSRPEFLEKGAFYCYNNYRVCAKHFTDEMFSNDKKNRLVSAAFPIVIEKETDSQFFHLLDHQYTNIYDNTEHLQDNSTCSAYETAYIEHNDVAVQTNSKSDQSYEVSYYNHIVKSLAMENYKLKTALKVKSNVEITQEQFFLLCDKFLPTTVSKFVKNDLFNNED